MDIASRAARALVLALLYGCSSGSSGGGGAPPFVPNFLAADVRIDSQMALVGGIPAEVSCSGLNVYVAWIDNRNGGSDVYFNRSFDGGTTWFPAAVRVDRDVASTAVREWVRIASCGLSVYVVWEDRRNGSTDIYFNRSLDGGSNWLAADIRLDLGTGVSRSADLCCDGTAVHVVWEDSRNGAYDIYYNRSANSGATWLGAPIRLETDLPGAASSYIPRICCDGLYVYAAWIERRPNVSEEDVYGNASTDGGVTWRPSDYRIKTDPAGTTQAWLPVICCSGPYAYVAWEDQRNGAEDVYFNSSSDAGATWGASDRRLDTDVAGSFLSRQARVCCDGLNVYVAWEDIRNGSGGSGLDLYFNRSMDGGATWLASDVRLDTDAPGAASSYLGGLTCSGSIVCVVSQDDRTFSTVIQFNFSNDAGATWQSSDLRLDTDGTPTAFSGPPRMCQDGRNVYVVWPDYRNAPLYEVFINRSLP